MQRDHGLLDAVPAQPRHQASKWSAGDWWVYLWRGVRPPPCPSYTGVVEDPVAGRIGIACSGGGVRSAAFSLGALQELQGQGILQKADYVAAVSGGAYIASAFYMVHKTWGSNDSEPTLVSADHPPFCVGSPEEQYLRNRIDYMAPGGLGLLRLAMRVVLGMAFNLCVIVLFLATLAFTLAFAYRQLYPALGQHVHEHACDPPPCGFGSLGIPQGVWIPLAGIGAAAALLGLLSMLLYPWRFAVREAFETWSIRLLLLGVAGGLVLIGLPLLVGVVRDIGTSMDGGVVSAADPNSGAGVGVVGGVGTASVLTTLVLSLRADVAEARRLAKEAQGAITWYLKLASWLRRALAYGLAWISGPLLSLGVFAFACSWVLNWQQLHSRLWALGIAGGAFAVVYFLSDLTSWSLHPFYRRRLESAFALRRVAREADEPPLGRRDCGKAVERDPAKLIRLSEIESDPSEPCSEPPKWPTLLVCAAANISDTAATPPGRSVSSFTFSAHTMGGPLVGAVRTREFEDAVGDRRRAFTLPAAVAMSGAALSPSMGKMTRRPLTFLLTLTNLRLGVWVPNPRRIEQYERGRSTRPRLSYLLREMLGRNLVDSKFLYVTDGGHYDNLGLVELVRRGCTDIYCFDATNDNFDALGDAVALARSELQVDIEIDSTDLRPEGEDDLAKADWVPGVITYRNGTTGELRYARTVLTKGDPADVWAYHNRDPRFPHNPTADQLYRDERFEAYRKLGARAARHTMGLP